MTTTKNNDSTTRIEGADMLPQHVARRIWETLTEVAADAKRANPKVRGIRVQITRYGELDTLKAHVVLDLMPGAANYTATTLVHGIEINSVAQALVMASELVRHLPVARHVQPGDVADLVDDIGTELGVDTGTIGQPRFEGAVRK